MRVEELFEPAPLSVDSPAKTRVESPELEDEYLLLKEIIPISVNALNRSYQHISSLPYELELYRKVNGGGGYIAGRVVGDRFPILVSISTRDIPFPITPKQLDGYFQVAMVNVNKGDEERGYTSAVYTKLAQLTDVVSDHKQYLGAKDLWKSLAKSSVINVHVFDGNINDYIRDANGVIVKYNGTNLDDTRIWGKGFKYKGILLVGTARELA